MTKPEFIKHWRNHLAGLALFGAASEARLGTMERAARAMDIPDEVLKLLDRLYDDAQPAKPKDKP
jgi:hypothetical protein